MALTYSEPSTPTVSSRNLSTLVVKKSRWSPDPSLVLQEAQKDDNISSLHLFGLIFTENSIPELVELLEGRSWRIVYFMQCHPTPGVSCRLLSRALSQTRISKLLLHDSAELSSSLLMEQKLNGIQGLTLRQRQGLSNSQCLMLGKIVSCSKGLKELSLRGTPIASGALLAPGLAISYHLETLIIGETYLSAKSLSDLVVVANPKRCQPSIQATLRLLSSPQSNLKALDLSHLNLRSEHATVIAKALVDNNSCLEQLNLSFNNIGNKGLEAFARHLPQMKCLSKVSLQPNPWDNGTVLCSAMQQNTSVDYLDSLLCLPEAEMIRYYTTINRGGRRLVQQNQVHDDIDKDVPLGLWSLVLERAGRINYYTEHGQQAKADSIFYLLRNGPVFFQH
eukprot:scaffold4661_cov108-Cylindrotheca_fusiformis.AAC.5